MGWILQIPERHVCQLPTRWEWQPGSKYQCDTCEQLWILAGVRGNARWERLEAKVVRRYGTE